MRSNRNFHQAVNDGAVTCERGAIQPFKRDQSSAGLRSLVSAAQHPPSPIGISGQIICRQGPSRKSTIQLILNAPPNEATNASIVNYTLMQ